MCGIAGIVSFQQRFNAQQLKSIGEAMGRQILHRGPDDGGVWVDAERGVALSHRRLSIIDLSAHGHQPMISASGRFVLSYNGEIYNFRSLREQLDYPWQSESDTEVLLAAIECWGLEKTLQQCNGMFAFALWDRETQTLSLARDRMGEKPLYVGKVNGDWVFASELKAFRAVPDFAPTIDRGALTQYMRYSCISAPHSIYQDISKLEPGHYLQINAQTQQLQSKSYWSFAEMAQQGAMNRSHLSEAELTDQLEVLLREAVGLRMVADVPLGAFLSGGIDSSTIVAMMQVQSSRPVKTFSIGFAEAGFDEAPYAKAVAQHLGTEHTELYVSPDEARSVIPKLPALYDEPFADSSQIPTYLVSQMARQEVTVSLSGDGGDELFGGYNRYLYGPKIWQMISWLPASARAALADAALIPSIALLHKLMAQPPAIARKLQNIAAKLHANDEAAFYRLMASVCLNPIPFIKEGRELAEGYADVNSSMSYSEWMMLQDTITYLPHDILTKVDRAAMGVSLETRIPLFDPALMAFAWQLPETMKVNQGKGKWLLRQVLYRHVPSELIDRPKAGFSLPMAKWLRGELREWAEDLLSYDALQHQHYWQPDQVQRYWREHCSGARDHQMLLWNILMFQSWYQEYHSG